MTPPTVQDNPTPNQVVFQLSAEDRPILALLAADSTDPAAQLAQILLACDEGRSVTVIARETGVTRKKVYYWRRRYRVKGLQTILGERIALATKPPVQEEVRAKAEAQVREVVQEQPATAPAPRKPKKLKSKKAGAPEITSDIASTPGDSAPVMAAAQDSQALVKPRTSVGMQASDTLAEAGRKVFSFFLARMLYHEAGTRLGEDIEELHDMRVATRRMRAAFDIFGAAFKPQRVKEHLKGLRSTGRALGAVRDWDVFLEKADQDIHHLSAADQENLTFLLEHWRAEREAARRAMIAYLDSPAYLRFVSEFNIFVTTPGKHEEVIKDGSFSGEPVPAVRAMAHLAPVLIYTRLGAVRAFTDLIPHAKIVQLHALRIQFKSLHYILDFLKEILGPQNKNVLAAVKRMQDHLGDLNDAEVACQRLSLLLENWEKNQLDTPLAERRNPESLLAYLSLKHLQRHELLIRFPAAWAEFDTFELRQQLAEALAVL